MIPRGGRLASLSEHMSSTVIMHALGLREQMKFPRCLLAAVIEEFYRQASHSCFAAVLIREVVGTAVITAHNDSGPLPVRCRRKNVLLARYVVRTAERRQQNHPAFGTIQKIRTARVRPWHRYEEKQATNEYRFVGRVQGCRLAFLRFANLAIRRSTSCLGADRIRFMILSNRSNGVAPPGSSPGGIIRVDCLGLLICFSAFRVPDELCACSNRRIIHLARQLLIGQATARDGGQNFREAPPVSVIVLALVIPERLLVQIAEQMEGFDADVGSFQAALEQRPEILDPIRVHIATNILFGMIHELVDVIRIEASIGRQLIGEHFRSRFDVRAHFRLQCVALAIGDMLHADLASLAIKQTHDQFFPRAASASDLLRFFVLVHEARESTDESLVGFNRPASTEFRERTALHRKPNAMEHEPCGFLTDFQISREFARTDSVLAIADQPDSGQPLSQRQRRVLEDGSDLNAELTAVMLLAALPAALIGEIMDFIASANRALHDAVRPTARNNVCDAAILIGVVADRICQGFWRVFVRVHVLNLAQGRRLVKSILVQIRTLPATCRAAARGA